MWVSVTFRGRAFHPIIEDHSGVRKPTDLSDVSTVVYIRANEVSNPVFSNLKLSIRFTKGIQKYKM